MKTLLAVAAFALVATPALAADYDISGHWTGGYIGVATDDANLFEFKITARGRAFSGTGTETNGFGDVTRALFLTSDIQGRVSDDGSVSFVKTYDGSGGVSHSVRYSGRFDSTGRRIKGTYDAGGQTGSFEMVK